MNRTDQEADQIVAKLRDEASEKVAKLQPGARREAWKWIERELSTTDVKGWFGFEIRLWTILTTYLPTNEQIKIYENWAKHACGVAQFTPEWFKEGGMR